MLSERILSRLIHTMTKQHLALNPTSETTMPPATPGQKYMLYMHVPFCERLCPYCSFNRYPFREEVARPYFANMRKEMLMLKDLGYDFESIYVGGGTPTVMIDELCETLDLARDEFNIREVASETNPNHLTQPWLDKLQGRVQRLSVGVQSFDDDLLKQMDRYEKYGSGDVILERIAEAEPYFDSLNVDMIFNFPSQTEDVLMADLEKIALSGCRQTTFSPLYVSSATTRKMAATLGAMDYDREYRYYQILDGVLAGGDDPLFDRTTLWTFTRPDKEGKPADAPQIDEYQVNYDEYPAHVHHGQDRDEQARPHALPLPARSVQAAPGQARLRARLRLQHRDGPSHGAGVHALEQGVRNRQRRRADADAHRALPDRGHVPPVPQRHEQPARPGARRADRPGARAPVRRGRPRLRDCHPERKPKAGVEGSRTASVGALPAIAARGPSTTQRRCSVQDDNWVVVTRGPLFCFQMVSSSPESKRFAIQ